MSYYLENKLSEIIGQPVGCVRLTRTNDSEWQHAGYGYLHWLILATVSFECKVKPEKKYFGSLKMLYRYNCGDHYFCEAKLLKGKETDELFFACAKDFLPNLKEPV